MQQHCTVSSACFTKQGFSVGRFAVLSQLSVICDRVVSTLPRFAHVCAPASVLCKANNVTVSLTAFPESDYFSWSLHRVHTEPRMAFGGATVHEAGMFLQQHKLKGSSDWAEDLFPNVYDKGPGSPEASQDHFSLCLFPYLCACLRCGTVIEPLRYSRFSQMSLCAQLS